MENWREKYANSWRIRPDGPAKVTGKLQYLSDLSAPQMLWGKVLRSAYPHARIIHVDTTRAKQLPGVYAVLTHEDVPGMNRFGIVFPDQPVFCEDKVRYIGDAIAAVAATTLTIADEALRLIEVTYEPLPVVSDPQVALQKETLHVHSGGNLLHRAVHSRGDIEKAFDSCAYLVEAVYETPRQMHVYMETEGGLFVPHADGTLTIYAGTQHGFKDRMQLARILAMPESDITVISSPMGGSFGGKDELNIQPYGSLLAIATCCPVKIHQSREESIRAGLKRHPMRITMKTGCDELGQILAHQVQFIADTGAYATLGPAVVDFAVEHATGPYRIPHVDIEGLAVYTNNGVAGEFRGFGGNQITFALEGQMDRLAQKMQMNPLEFRSINLRSAQDLGPLMQRIAPTNGARDVLTAISQAQVWERIDASLRPDSHQLQCVDPMEEVFACRGKGLAIAMHGGGLGFGRPDASGGRLLLNAQGKIEVRFGFEEFGQGILGTIERIVVETIGCAYEDVIVILGDTSNVPSSGSSTASRSTSMVWKSLQQLKASWTEQVLVQASHVLDTPIEQLQIGPNGIFNRKKQNVEHNELLLSFFDLAKGARYLPDSSTHFHFPTTPDAVLGAHYVYSFAAVAVSVEVDRLTGQVRVLAIEQAIAAGPIVNSMGYLGQIEGGGVMALGFTLMEDALIEDGLYMTQNIDSYLIPTIEDIPLHSGVTAMEGLVEGDPYGPRGVGEIGMIAIAPAIAAAIYDATGCLMHKLPIVPEDMLAALEERDGGGFPLGHVTQ